MSEILSLEKLKLCLAEAGLQAELRNQNAENWSAVVQKCVYVPVAYTEVMINYQLVFLESQGWELMDLSVVLFHDHQPRGIWPLCVRKKNNILVIGSNEGAVLPPLFVQDLAAISIKSQITACLNFLDCLSRLLGCVGYDSLIPFRDERGIGEWQNQLLFRGAKMSVRQGLWVDMTWDLAQIKASFRKSYKSLINAESGQWSLHYLTEADLSIWYEFRDFHRWVAGRITRSNESWDRQLEAIRAGAAFLVFLRDMTGRMIGGSFFHVSRDEALYAVAAFDRNLPDLPLGHVVQYAAIQELLRRKLKWYYLGTRCYPQDVPPPTSKEVNVTVFKEGFATHRFPEFNVTYVLSAVGAYKKDFAPIVGERLSLRLLQWKDITDEYVNWLNDPEVNRYLEARFQAHTRPSTIQYVQQMFMSSRDFLFGIFLNDSQDYIGTIKVGDLDEHHRSAELGVMLGRRTAWGKGYGTEAVELATRFAFENLRVHKIVASIYKSNKASIKIFEHVGYRRIGHMSSHRLCDGQYVDCELVEMVNLTDGP